MTTDHRNLTRRDFEFEDYDAYLDHRLERFFNEPDDYLETQLDNFVHDAKRLYENGKFGLLLKTVDNQPSRAKWTHKKHADCIRCGKPEVSILGVIRAVETPSGDIQGIDQHSELCPECADRVEEDLREHGEPQPTLAGKWWTTGGESA